MSIYKFLDNTQYWFLRRQGFKSHFQEVNGGGMHYFERMGKGENAPIVFIHGMSSDAAEMAPLYKKMVPHFRKVISIDLPGHGKSPRPEGGMNSEGIHAVLTQALDAVFKEPVFVYGNSLGGLAAIRYALHAPQNIKGLILSSPGGASMSPGQLAEFKERLRNLEKTDISRFTDMLFYQVPRPRRLLEKLIHYRFNREPIRELYDNVVHEALLRPDEVGGLEPPTLVTWGQKDALQHPQVDFFREHLPDGADLVEPEFWSHVPHLERPGEVAKVVLEFVKKVGE